MSYKEIAMQAIYDRNKKYPDDYPTHKPYSEDEKRELDKIFANVKHFFTPLGKDFFPCTVSSFLHRSVR